MTAYEIEQAARYLYGKGWRVEDLESYKSTNDGAKALCEWLEKLEKGE